MYERTKQPGAGKRIGEWREGVSIQEHLAAGAI